MNAIIYGGKDRPTTKKIPVISTIENGGSLLENGFLILNKSVIEKSNNEEILDIIKKLKDVKYKTDKKNRPKKVKKAVRKTNNIKKKKVRFIL